MIREKLPRAVSACGASAVASRRPDGSPGGSVTPLRSRFTRLTRYAITALLALTTLSPVAGAQTVTMREVVRYAIANYPSVVAANAERQIAAQEIIRARGKHYPTVDVAGAQRLSGDSDNQFGPRLRMNLWASGAIDAEIERETWREQAATSNQLLTREDVAFDVVSAYLDLLGAMRQEEVARRNLARHADLVNDFREIARLDPGRRFDLVQARARQSQVQLAVAQRQADIATARESLARYYPYPFEASALREPPDLSEPPPASEARLQALLDQHPAVRAADQQLQAARANVEMARAERGPRIDVEARAGANRFSQLTFSWPAFDLSAGASQRAAEAGLESARAGVDEQRRLATESQRTAAQSYRSARDQQTIALSQVSIAEQLVTVYREQFGIGRRNLLDLLNAYAELANAESAVAGSRIQAIRARHQMEHAAGRLSLLFQSRSQ